MTIQDLIDSLGMENTPAGGRLLVFELAKASTSFIIDIEENREKPEPGIVLRIGQDGVGPETGRLVPVVSKPGDVVWYGRYAGLRTTVEGPADDEGRRKPVPVLLMQDSEVLMRRDDPSTYRLVMHDNDLRKVHREGLHCEHCPVEKVDLDALKKLAAGEDDVIDAKVVDEAAPEDPEQRRKFIEEERARVLAERDGEIGRDDKNWGPDGGAGR